MSFFKEILNPLRDSILRYSNRNALCINEQFYTYSDLAASVSRVRSALKASGVTGKKVGLVANDDFETYASIIAVWLEGAAYVPLHTHQPVERSEEIIKQAEVLLLLDSSKKYRSQSASRIEIVNTVPQVINLDPSFISDDGLAYMLFTSGSTGKPKGVQISRRNLAAFIHSFRGTGITVNEKDRCLQCFDLTFDVSVQSFLVPLLKGACIYTIPHDQIKYSYVYGLLEDHKLTFGAMAPSMIRYLRPYFDEIHSASMRCNIITAEASPVDLVDEWSHCIPNAQIFNFYGPTEATIYCTYQKYKRSGKNKHLNGMMSIGKPMPGVDAIIVNENREIIGRTQKGELCISGDQITPGYWNDPEKNKDSFFELKFNGKMTRFYRTGDSCYIDDDDDIMLAGRLDHQVKIQGYRIELGEIEYHAREFARGQNIIALTAENSSGIPEIVLIVEEREYDTRGMYNYLKTKLPSYMLPSNIKFIAPFPLNNSGKTDRIKLKTLL